MFKAIGRVIGKMVNSLSNTVSQASKEMHWAVMSGMSTQPSVNLDVGMEAQKRNAPKRPLKSLEATIQKMEGPKGKGMDR